MPRHTIDGDTAERLFKAGLSLPPGSQVFTEQESRAISLSQGQKQDASAALPRGGDVFAPFPFNPGIPIIPAPISPRQKDGQPYPRRSDYPVSWNLPGVGSPMVPWRVLRQAGDETLVRRCIELRKSELCFTDWDIVPKSDALTMLAEVSGQGMVATKKQLLKDMNAQIRKVKAFFEKPDRLNDLSFSDWLGGVLEEHFVYDAASIYPWRDNTGNLHSFVSLNGATIKPLLDIQGNRPQPPAPAFQQIIAGFPRGEFTDVGGADDEWASTDLVYAPKVRRTDSPYGFSNVEQCLPVLDLWLKRQAWIRAEYTDGVKPETWMRLTKEMKPEQLIQWQTVVNEMLAGQTEERQRITVLPMGFDPQEAQQFAEKYHPTFDEFLIKMICLCFDVQPMEVGFLPSAGLGGKGLGDAQEDVTYRRSIRPMFKWLTGLLNDLATRYCGMPSILTFRFNGQEEEDETLTAAVRKEEQMMGVLTLNDRRAEKGLALYDFAEADEPMIVTTRGVVPIRGALSTPGGNVAIGPTPIQANVTQQASPGVPANPGDQGTQANPGDQGDQGTGAEPADGAGGSQPPSAPPPSAPKVAVADEAKRFTAFAKARVKAGAWRPFAFESALVAVQDDLNRAGEGLDLGTVKLAVAAATKVVKDGDEEDPLAESRRKASAFHKARERIAKTAVPALRSAFAGLIVDLPDVVQRYADHLGKAVGPSEIEHARHVLNDAVSLDVQKTATDSLQDAYSEGYVSGAAVSQDLMDKAVTFAVGNWRAEAKLLGEDGTLGLKGLLAEARVTIRSIADNRLDVLARALADGVSRGDPVRVVAKNLQSILDDPTRAEMVAHTEINRAMSQASLDQYRQAKLTQKVWLTADNPCPTCEANEDQGAIGLEDDFDSGDSAPPAHPNCLCALLPVVPGME